MEDESLPLTSILDNFINLTKKFDESQMKLVDIHKDVPDSYIIYNGFSDEECEFLINNMKFEQEIEFKDIQTGKVYRKNLRSEIHHPRLAHCLFERIKKFLPKSYHISEDDKELGALTKGTWEPSYLNGYFRICKYLNEGFFGPHVDGCYVINENERSLYTLMFYLNANFDGGETVFLNKEDNSPIVRIKPEKGMMIFFPQNLLHEGLSVIGEKFIFRTDIIFKRCNDGKMTKEENDIIELATKYFQLAQDLERSKNGREAVEYYKKAFKLNPNLEKVMK